MEINGTVSNFRTNKTRKKIYEYYDRHKEVGTDSHFTCLKEHSLTFDHFPNCPVMGGDYGSKPTVPPFLRVAGAVSSHLSSTMRVPQGY